tara:strand:- start:37144 stop:37293 length:150 start_codon:yes stop_codon:yes gene_type:complete
MVPINKFEILHKTHSDYIYTFLIICKTNKNGGCFREDIKLYLSTTEKQK